MKNLRKNLLPITTFVRIDAKRLFRDKVAIFFVFLFPMIFLVIFGSIFGGDSEVSFRVGLINHSKTDFAIQFVNQTLDSKVLKVDKDITTLDQAKEKMNRSQIEATIILPEDFGAIDPTNKYPTGQAKILYDQNNESAGQTLTSVMTGIFKGLNADLVDNKEPFIVTSESTATKGLSRFDYTFSGIMGFTLLSLGIFGPTTVFPRLKQKGVLRRYSTTTLKVWQYFIANVLSNAFIGFLAAAAMFVLALIAFDLNMRGNYLNLIVVCVVGVTMLYGIGLALGGWAKNENQAAPLANLTTLPMMFLSGVFFPTFLMPELLQNITKYIPLTPIIDSIRLVITENASLLDLGPQFTVIGVWTVIIYIIALKVFRWE